MNSSPESTAEPFQASLPNFADVEAAAERLAGHAVATPLLSSPALDRRVG
ncbi:MAG: pyridoxal-5'-phosphate-dependent protein, partial [Proteobacteria bacterium]|nr:pyridoxal-5'-phosphate-dependent protein [Pseudomonadota bacterium]